MMKKTKFMVFVVAGFFCIGQGISSAGFFSFGEKKNLKAETKQEAPASKSQQTDSLQQAGQGDQLTGGVEAGAVASDYGDAENVAAQLPTASLPPVNPAASLPKVPKVSRAPSVAKVNLTAIAKPPTVLRPIVSPRPIQPIVPTANRSGAATLEVQKNLAAMKNKRQESVKIPKV